MCFGICFLTTVHEHAARPHARKPGIRSVERPRFDYARGGARPRGSDARSVTIATPEPVTAHAETIRGATVGPALGRQAQSGFGLCARGFAIAVVAAAGPKRKRAE